MNIAQRLHSLYEGSELTGNSVYFPEWGGVTLHPNIDSLRRNSAVLGVKLSCPEWDRDIYESATGIGTTDGKALNMALGGLAFGLMDTVRLMQNNSSSKQLESELVGTRHRWHVYEGNTLCIGDDAQTMPSYWQLLSDGISKRLGNQKICYVKVYIAKYEDDINCECRINDVVSPELSQLLSEHASLWDTVGFSSQKQFILLKQDEDTYTSYPYTAEMIAEYTRLAIELFEDFDAEYDDYVELLAARIGDVDLAQELYMFLPEMCAENAFNEIAYTEDIGLYIRNSQKKVYKSQIASYYPILNALYTELSNGNFTDELYSKYVYASSIYNVICQAHDAGTDLANGGKIFVSHGTRTGYRLR